MPRHHKPDLRHIVEGVRRGRFSDALADLKNVVGGLNPSGTSSAVAATLADVLQRTGHINDAQSIATQTLRRGTPNSAIAARCHFVLGNVCREIGDSDNEIKHLQTSLDLAGGDFDLTCWAHLRLLAAIADRYGPAAALARLDGTKQLLAQSGDPRPFAALHLWLAELETTQGSLSGARQHLREAGLLLSSVDDIWLNGYFATNSSVISYYSGELSESEREAEIALSYSQASGHRATRRAANAALGHIHLLRGKLIEARKHFEDALADSELGSVSHIALLDSNAQVALLAGDLDSCRTLLDQLDRIEPPQHHSKARHYLAWGLQTKIQLLLKQGKGEDAKLIIQRLTPQLTESPKSRIALVAATSAAEILIANGELCNAASVSACLLTDSVQMAPDLLAELERVTGKALYAAGELTLARVHLERAENLFKIVGDATGRRSLSFDRRDLDEHPPELNYVNGVRTSLDRIRALIDTRSQPKMFGIEAEAWLSDLGCAESYALITDECLSDSGNEHTTQDLRAQRTIRVELGDIGNSKCNLVFAVRRDVNSIIMASEFARVLRRILDDGPLRPMVAEAQLWSPKEGLATNGMVCAANSMAPVLNVIRTIARTDLSVLITGETGVGKEVIARTIHQHSARSAMPFSALNCAAVPKDLLESQLFGFKKGAFSGAAESFGGIVRAANGGTLLLDEIGELSLEAQAKLLRFLEMGEVHPIGEAFPVKVNVRLLFSTNTDLGAAVKEKRFREDLFYRISVVPIRVPPLRERREDIPRLVDLFSHKSGREFSKEPVRFTDAAIERLMLYNWPGNVRQLSNEIRRISAFAEPGTPVTPDLLSPEIRSATDVGAATTHVFPHVRIGLAQTLERATAQLEREMLNHALERADGHVLRAAEALGLSRKGLYLKRKRLGLADLDIAPSN